MYRQPDGSGTPQRQRIVWQGVAERRHRATAKTMPHILRREEYKRTAVHAPIIKSFVSEIMKFILIELHLHKVRLI